MQGLLDADWCKCRRLQDNRQPGAITLRTFTSQKRGNMCVSWAALARSPSLCPCKMHDGHKEETDTATAMQKG